MSGQVPISGLPTATTITGAELVPVVQGGATKQTTVGAVAAAGLSPVTGASLVGANDGAGGSLFTTVQGFIDNSKISFSSQGLETTLAGYPGALGTEWQSQYHANWNVIQTQIPDNPTEWQIYSGASGGAVATVMGTNQVTWVSGAQFKASWAGLPYIYIDGTLYSVLAVTSATSLTVQTTGGGTVSWAASASVPYYFCATSTQGTCSVNGTAVTWLTGQPFILYPTTIIIAGVSYAVAAFNSPVSLTLATSAGVQTSATFLQYCNINNELSNLRLQSTGYADQENFCITQTANGAILETQYGGLGKYRPIKIRTGEQPAGNQQVMIALYPAATLGQPGTLLLGGDFNDEVLNITCNVNNVNYFNVQGGATGVSPSIAVRGTDAAPGFGIDLKGAGVLSVTSHTFGNIEFQVFGVGGSSWLGVASDASAAPTISANGAAANINIKLAPKGTGAVMIPLANIQNAANDTAAAAAVVPVGGLYRTTNAVQVRIA